MWKLAMVCAAALGSLVSPPVVAASPYSVRNFGAAGDGVTLDTDAIQAAVDAASAAGGGTVIFPPGRYLSGTIFLKSHIRLDLDTGATLLASPDYQHFPAIMNNHPSRTDRYCNRALLRGEGLEDIAITGRGTIDGQGALFRDAVATAEEMAEFKAAYDAAGRYVPNDSFINRPYIIQFVSCRNLLIEDIHLRNSPMWMQHYLDCDFLTVRGINVYNHAGKNNDMIDIDGCRNVTVADCVADTDDDALTLKSNGPRATEDVTITNCILRSHCNAIKAGTESYGGFRNITISNCVVETSAETEALSGRPEGLAGIALEVVDGGTMEGVTVDNVVIRGTTAPIFVRIGNRARPPKPGMDKPPVGLFRNVILSNIIARDAGNVGCAIAGLPDHPIENLTLSNIRMEFAGGVTADQVAAEIPENETGYPECTMFGTLPAYGLYVRHAKGVTIDGVRLGHDAADERPAIACDDVEELSVDGFQADGGPALKAQITLNNTRDALIRGSIAANGALFLGVDDKSRNVTLLGNDLSRAASAVAGANLSVHELNNRLPNPR